MRTQVNWNEWPLRWQMVMHIATLIFFFSLTYCIFLSSITFASYRNNILNTGQTQLAQLYTDKLSTTSTGINMCLYHYDRLAQKQALLFSDLFS